MIMFHMFARWILNFSLIVWLAGCGSDGPQTTAEANSVKPNIVLVLFEDASPRFGAYGDRLAQTPNFDRIAKESVRYTHVFTTSGVCAPSRAALITGRHQMTIGAQHMRTSSGPGFPIRGPQNYLAVPPPEVKAFPELLRAGGYYTANNFKTDYQFGEPFTIWDQSANDADWEGRKDGQPFFFMQTYLTSHESMLWTEQAASDHPLGEFVLRFTKSVRDNRRATVDPADVDVPPYYPDTPGVRRDIAVQYDNIAFTDAMLGELYKRLDAGGLLDNTILIISTDHGDGLPRAKRSLYDSGLRVPMIIRYPDGWRAGEIDDQLISFLDLAPTILSWAGVQQPDWMHGRDFVGDDRDPEREYVFAAQDRMDEDDSRRRAVRDHRYKYILNAIPGDPYFAPILFRSALLTMKDLQTGYEERTLPPAAAALFEPLPEEQLYDTRADPHEVSNLASSPMHKQARDRLNAELLAWMNRMGDMSEMSEAEMIETMWPGGAQPSTAAPEVHIDEVGGRRLITLSSTTEGASIGYQFGSASEAWELYTAPLEMTAETELRAKAVRYGFAESPVTTKALE